MQSASNSERGRVRRPELVPLPGPAEDGVPGHVGEVGDGPVGVAARVRGLAASVGLDPLPDLSLGVGRAARLQVLLRPACARTASLRSTIRCAPTTPAKPTSITLRCASTLSPTRKPARKTAAAGEQPHRPDGRRRARRPVAPRDPDAAAEQVDERRIRERRAPEDLALVEEAERDREREQREQVEVAERERPPQVGEPDDEERAERQPQPDGR